jgi:hypothetical protein
MQLEEQLLNEAGNNMFLEFMTAVKDNNLAAQCREDYYEQAGIMDFQTIPRERQNKLDNSIYCEILYYGAFCLSIGSVPYCIKKAFFSQKFDRLSWAAIYDGIEGALGSEMIGLDKSHTGNFLTAPSMEAKSAVIGYMQNFTNNNAHADLLVLYQQAMSTRSTSNLGCLLFSERMSLTIDPGFAAKYALFKTQWKPFAQQILEWTAPIVKSTIENIN